MEGIIAISPSIAVSNFVTIQKPIRKTAANAA